MQRVAALIIGLPLLVGLLYVLWKTIRVYLDSVKERDFVGVDILGNRDRLLKDVSKYILSLNEIGESVPIELHDKFSRLKTAITLSQIEFATAELAQEFERAKDHLAPEIKEFLRRE